VRALVRARRTQTGKQLRVSIYIRLRIYTAGILILARRLSRAICQRHKPVGPRLCSAVCIIESVGARLSFVSRPRPRIDNICAYAQINTRLSRAARGFRGGIAKTFARTASE